jgi:hypothetical protein
MSALTRNTSGRVVLVALVIGLIGAMMAIALFPADAADGGEQVGSVNGDACETLGLPGESFAFDIPKGAPNDESRVFAETYDLKHDVSVDVLLPSNRSHLDFDMTDGLVSAVVVFGRNNQRNGTLYEYGSGSFKASDSNLTSLYTGNIKRVTLCYGQEASPSIATVVSRPTAAIDDSISDRATLSGDFQAEGTITFTVYRDDATCTPPYYWESKAVDVTDGSADLADLPDADSFTPTERGTYYWVASYSGDGFNHPTNGKCGDANEISTVFDALFLCDVPITMTDASLGLKTTFIRPDGSEGCASTGDSDKFGNLDFSVDQQGEDIIQFTPSGEGQKTTFVGELTYDVAAGAVLYDILHIDASANGNGTFVPMKWYSTLTSIDYDNGVISGATFTCPTLEEWCILSATIDKGQIVWVIGGPSVDPRFR